MQVEGVHPQLSAGDGGGQRRGGEWGGPPQDILLVSSDSGEVGPGPQGRLLQATCAHVRALASQDDAAKSCVWFLVRFPSFCPEHARLQTHRVPPQLCALVVDYQAGSLHCLDSVVVPLAPVRSRVYTALHPPAANAQPCDLGDHVLSAARWQGTRPSSRQLTSPCTGLRRDMGWCWRVVGWGRGRGRP